MSDEEQVQFEDETRLCPVCRMAISVWATRCRFCGEEVGRPRREEKKLTLKDLGTPEAKAYKLSDEVRDALEEFRKEMAHTQSPPGLGHHGNNPGSGIDNFPKLDSNAMDILQSTYKQSNSNSKPQTTRKNSSLYLSRTIALGIAFLIGALMLYYVLGAGYQSIASYFRHTEVVDTIPDYNRALNMLEKGESPVAALEEALRALKYHDTAFNRDVAEAVRDNLESNIHTLLKQEPWRQTNFDRASALISRAVLIDSNSRIRQLQEVVEKEIASYKFVLRSVNNTDGTAAFILNNPYLSATEEVVREGEYLQDRFLVSGMTSREVRLLDSRYETERGFRRLVSRVLEPVSSP